MKHSSLFYLALILAMGTFQTCQTTKIAGPSPDPDAESVPLPVAGELDMDALYGGLDLGGPITLRPLTYVLDEPIRIQASEFPFSMDGNGAAFVMRDPDANVIEIFGANDVTLKNFKATHIEPNGPLGCLGSVIAIDGASSVRIENCELNGSGIIGVVAYDTENLTIVNNYIYNNSQYGVLYDLGTSLEILNNRFEDNGEDGSAHVGQAQDPGLREVIMMDGDQNQEGLKMSGNRYE